MSNRRKLKQAKRPDHQIWSRALAITGLSLLAGGAIVLTAIAIAGPGDAASTTQIVQPRVAPQVVEPTPTPEPVPAATAEVVHRFLAASETPGHLIRATAGACPEPVGSIEVSFDGGAQWAPASTADVASTQILQLDTATTGLSRFISLNAECQPQVNRSFVGGADWEPDEGLASVWYLDVADSAVVHTPSGAQLLPCIAVGLASQAERAITLCSDSRVTTSTDDGASWSEPIAIANAAAVGTTDAGFIVASVDEPECVGVRTRGFTDGAIGEPGQCLAVEGAAGGNTAITGRAGELFLWAGGAFTRSLDGGGSWQ